MVRDETRDLYVVLCFVSMNGVLRIFDVYLFFLQITFSTILRYLFLFVPFVCPTPHQIDPLFYCELVPGLPTAPFGPVDVFL